MQQILPLTVQHYFQGVYDIAFRSYCRVLTSSIAISDSDETPDLSRTKGYSGPHERLGGIWRVSCRRDIVRLRIYMLM
jgi:hypothetical protein